VFPLKKIEQQTENVTSHVLLLASQVYTDVSITFPYITAASAYVPYHSSVGSISCSRAIASHFGEVLTHRSPNFDLIKPVITSVKMFEAVSGLQ
jgi:hypothetical protein